MRSGLELWRTFVSEYPELVEYFAYDFPQDGTKKQYTEWAEKVALGVRGDPMNPTWVQIFITPFPVQYKDQDAQRVLNRLYQMYRYVASVGPDKLWSDQRRYDMYILPSSYVFILPHTPYGWGFMFAATSGMAYILLQRFRFISNPLYVWISPGTLRHVPDPPFHIIPGRYPPLAIRGLPRSDEYQPDSRFTRISAFKIRPAGVDPRGMFVVGLLDCEQYFPVGRLGKEVFLSPMHTPVIRMALKLADVSAYLTNKVLGRYTLGTHREYTPLARLDYALTLFHTTLLADFPAYRAALGRGYFQSDTPRGAPHPGHSLVLKVTGTPDQLVDVYNSLPFYVGFSMFPEIHDLIEVSKYYKRYQ